MSSPASLVTGGVGFIGSHEAALRLHLVDCRLRGGAEPMTEDRQASKTSLEDGIRAMAEWVERHGARQSSVFEGIEIERNLPPSWASVRK